IAWQSHCRRVSDARTLRLGARRLEHHASTLEGHAMTAVTQRPPRKDTVTDKLVSGTFGQIMSLISWFFLAIAFSILLEWGGVLAGWWGMDHARNVLLTEVSYLSQLESNDLLGLHPAWLATTALEKVNAAFSWIGIDKALR